MLGDIISNLRDCQGAAIGAPGVCVKFCTKKIIIKKKQNYIFSNREDIKKKYIFYKK